METNKEEIRVLIVEDDEDFIYLMKKMLDKQPKITVSGTCAQKEEAVQMACRLLRETQRSVSEIGYACGLGSSSYFGKVFREVTGSTPTDYRAKWQDRDIIGR